MIKLNDMTIYLFLKADTGIVEDITTIKKAGRRRKWQDNATAMFTPTRRTTSVNRVAPSLKSTAWPDWLSALRRGERSRSSI
jgi:hypothetical protein